MTPELRETALRLLGEGQSITAVAQAIGKSRQALYRDPEFRAAALARSEPDPDPPPWDERGADNRAGLSRWDAELEGEQIAAFCKALRRTRKIPAAARAANVDLRPDRVRWADLSKQKRQVIRDALEAIRQPDVDPVAPTREAFEAWNQGQDWSMNVDHIDTDELRRLSPRAADSLESTLRGRAVVLARMQPKKSKPDDSDWEAF